MRLPRPRFSLKGMMVVILVFAVGFHLAATARQVYSHRGQHIHTGILDSNPIPVWFMSFGQRQAFWPTFWRCSLGLSSTALRTCRIGGGVLEEACELDHPEIRKALGPNSFGTPPTEGQIALYLKLMGAKGRKVDYVIGGFRIEMPDKVLLR